MKDLIKRNYKSIVNRGLITPDTTKQDFLNKLYEEINELEIEINNNNFENIKFELSDVILTALNFAYHYNIDIMEYLEKKILINYKRSINRHKKKETK